MSTNVSCTVKLGVFLGNRVGKWFIEYALAMQSGGAVMTKPSKAVGEHLLWFFAHEAAHLYQFANGIGFDTYRP